MASVERFVAAMGPKASAGMGGNGGGGVFRSGSRSEWAGWVAAGLDTLDEALLAWECGHDDPVTQSQVWVRLMERGSRIVQEAPRPWPHGMLPALVGVAMVELRPRPAPMRAWERLEALRVVGHHVDKRRWSECWAARYQALLGEAWACSARARWRLAAVG